MTEKEAVIDVYPQNGLHGRRKIYTDVKEITSENVADVLSEAWATHLKNRREIQYLYDFYRGKQDIRCKQKLVRPEINNIVMVNRANEIVTFKVSYLLSEPLQYVSRGGDDNKSQDINLLNDFVYSEDKATKDKEIADWMHICGVGVRMVLPDPVGEEDGSPANIYTLDPRDAFVIYSSNIGNKSLAGVLRRKDENSEWISCVYTPAMYFEVKNGKVIDKKPRTVPYVPIIEYVNNEARMGAFEIVLPLLNAINTLESGRVDSVEDFVNAYDVFQNCEIQDGEYGKLSQGGMMVKIRSVQGLESKVYRISSEMDQNSTQTIVDDMYDTVLTICGMPNRNGGSSTSDTGAATIMRDGWSAAESRAKDTEALWCRSERETLRCILKICKDTTPLDLKLSDIGFKFTRRNYADIQSKAQVLAEMLNNSKIHPKLAFQVCGLFTDAEDAYRISKEYYEQEQKKLSQQLKEEINASRESIHNGRQDDRTAEQESDQEVRAS